MDAHASFADIEMLEQAPGRSGAARVVARILRTGHRLFFGEVQVVGADDELAAQATATIARL